MKRMTLQEFKDYVKSEDANITFKKSGIRNFILTCKKCGSTNVKMRTEFDYSYGDTGTGIYGESVTLMFKCVDCGNAEAFVDE
jgi:DNA-directed RNA polymerase subunit M/transcription elongation factor TFIIS